MMDAVNRPPVPLNPESFCLVHLFSCQPSLQAGIRTIVHSIPLCEAFWRCRSHPSLLLPSQMWISLRSDPETPIGIFSAGAKNYPLTQKNGELSCHKMRVPGKFIKNKFYSPFLCLKKMAEGKFAGFVICLPYRVQLKTYVEN